jgi:hypothetical protein
MRGLDPRMTMNIREHIIIEVAAPPHHGLPGQARQ